MPRFSRITPRVPVTNLARTIVFYTRTLGFTLDILWPGDHPTFCILARDTVSIGFFVADSCRKVGAVGGIDLYIDVEDVQGLYEALKDTVIIDWGPEVYFYGRREFAVRDPDDYLVIFTEPTDDPMTSPEE